MLTRTLYFYSVRECATYDRELRIRSNQEKKNISSCIKAHLNSGR